MKISDLNRNQQESVNDFLNALNLQLKTEIERLLASGGVATVGDEVLLSTLFKVALENEAAKFGFSDKKAYKNMQKF